MNLRQLKLSFLTFILVMSATNLVVTNDRTAAAATVAECTANSDADNDGIILTSVDRDYIANYLKGCGPAPVVPYSYDLNGNGIVDTMDIKVWEDYLNHGFGIFSAYGGFPVPCPCVTVLVPYGTCCCTGTTGNVNGLANVDLADLSAFVSYLTGSGYVLMCVQEANVNGAGAVDLADLSALVSFLTGGGYVLPSCP